MKLVTENQGKTFNPPLHTGVTSREIVSQDTPAQHVAFHMSTIAPGGGGSELDTHPASEQIFYVLSGQVKFLGDGTELVARAGQAVFIPAGEPHASINEGDVDAVCLVITTPPL
jgi:quercetin dioxygenase-like cupin family protein